MDLKLDLNTNSGTVKEVGTEEMRCLKNVSVSFFKDDYLFT